MSESKQVLSVGFVHGGEKRCVTVKIAHFSVHPLEPFAIMGELPWSLRLHLTRIRSAVPSEARWAALSVPLAL